MDVAVLGAGPEGRDLAAVAARAGRDVSLHDGDATRVMDAIDRVERRLADAVDAGEISSDERRAILDRIDGTTGLEAAVSDAELIIETDVSGADALQERFAAIEELATRDALLAATIDDESITTAAAGLRQPGRAVGLHALDPQSAAVLEIVVADQTSRETVERVESFAEYLDCVPVVVRDTPGFASTRLALATEVEAMRIVADGIASVPDVDTAFADRFDHPIGPLERADRAGLDRRLDVLESVADALGERFRPPPMLEELVGSGYMGVETGRGFYDWEDGETAGSALPDPEIVERPAGPDDPAH